MSVMAMEWVDSLKAGSSGAKHVLTGLANFHQKKTGECTVGKKRLASFTELNWKTIDKWLAYLEEAGFITAEYRDGDTYNYILHFDITVSKIGGGSKAGNPKNLRKGTPSKIGDTDTSSKIGDGDENGTPSKISNDPLQKFHEPPPNLEDERDNGTNGLKDYSSEQPGKPPEKTEKEIRQERYLKCADEMWKRIEPIVIRKKPPNLETWARDIRYMVEIDNISIEHVWRVFDWANKHSFWRANVRSPEKLRKQFNALHLQREEDHAKVQRIDRRPGEPGGPRLTPAQRTAAKREAVRRQSAGEPPDVGVVAAHE